MICIHKPTNAEKLVKFGPVLAEIFGMRCRFLPSHTKIAQNVAEIVPVIASKAELR